MTLSHLAQGCSYKTDIAFIYKNVTSEVDKTRLYQCFYIMLVPVLLEQLCDKSGNINEVVTLLLKHEGEVFIQL